jgi:putative peptide zinc metalloprotease protein
LRFLAELFLFRLPHAQGAARTPTEAWLLPLYGVASILYWLALMSTIVVFVAGQYLELGILLAFVLIFTSVLMPLGKFLIYITHSPRLGAYRARAVTVSSAAVGGLLVVLTLVPMPDRVRVPGVLEAEHSRALHSEADGFFVELLARPGGRVSQDQPLLQLSNRDLDREIEAARMRRDELIAQEIRSISKGAVDYAPLARQRQAVDENLAQLLARQEALLVRAPIAGLWSASELDHTRGQWIARGASLGAIVQEGGWRFVAVLPQIGSHVFDGELQLAEVRLRGEEGVNMRSRQTRVMPFEQGTLPSRALGMAGGGAIAVSPSDPNGLTAAEPFFRVEARLEPEADADAMPALLHGRTGVMRMTLSSQPLLWQWERELRQFLQRRFRV